MNFQVLSQALDDLTYGATHADQDKIGSAMKIFIAHNGNTLALAERLGISASTVNGWSTGASGTSKKGAVYHQLIRKLNIFSELVEKERPITYQFTDAHIRAVSRLVDPTAEALSFLMKAEVDLGFPLDEQICASLLDKRRT